MCRGKHTRVALARERVWEKEGEVAEVSWEQEISGGHIVAMTIDQKYNPFN